MKKRHISSQHPLFAVERRRIRWANTPQRMQHTLWWVATTTAVVISIIMVLAIIYEAIKDRNYYYYSQMDLAVLNWLFVLSLTIVTVFLDFGAFLVNLTSIADDKTHLRWDLLVLAMEKDAYIRTKHEVAMLRIGRVLRFNLAMRTSVVIIFMLLMGFGGYFLENHPILVTDVFEDLQEYPIEMTLILLIGATLGLVYIVEPIWRTRAVTAMALAISTYTRHTMLAVPLAFFLMIFMWGILLVLLGLITFVAVQIAINLGDYFYSINLNYNDSIRLAIEFLGITIYVLTLIATGYTYYRLLVALSYKLTRRRIP